MGQTDSGGSDGRAGGLLLAEFHERRRLWIPLGQDAHVGQRHIYVRDARERDGTDRGAYPKQASSDVSLLPQS